jgi:hypothetical protein
MSLRTLSWIVFAVIAAGAVLLFNYWASYQPLSTLVYAGIVAALLGLANLALPFQFLGIRKRFVGALVLAAGIGLAAAALFWPASTIRAAQHKTRLDDIMPEYHFSERHSTRVHARPEQVMQAVRQSTFADMKSLGALLRIRGAVLRAPSNDNGDLEKKQIFDSFSEAGYILGGSDHEIVMCGAWNAKANQRPDIRTLHDFAAYREQGAVKMAYDFTVEDAGSGWSTLSTETRVAATDDVTRRGMGRYWRLIVPGSGLLRRQWLDGIKQRAESEHHQGS